VAIVALAVAVGGVGWYLASRTSRINGIRNVVLISIDTCRADRLSCYGFKRQTTPHVDAIARDGVLFREALSPVPLTTPAHSSMLTGTYPPTHGVRLNNGLGLTDASVTLAELLKDAGYRTAAFVGGFPLDAQFGLNQGFDTYDCRFTKKSETTSFYAERTAQEVSRPALAWLDGVADQPFFLFLHYYDAHLPFEPPPPFASAYPDDPYAGEIAYVDSWIGQVVERLKALHAYDDTLLIVTGDHGESLGEHGEKSHGFFVYQGSQHVPLVIRAPGGRKGLRSDDRVSLVDLVPTVLDLTGLKTPPHVQGATLRAALEGRTSNDPRRPLYCESLEATQFGCSSLNAIVEGRWKYIRAPREELYDLSRDPGEANNLVANEPQVVLRLREGLETMLQELDASAVLRTGSDIDPDAVRRLQSLGYVGGGATQERAAFDPGLEDPKDFAPTFVRLEKANALFHSQRNHEAEAELTAIVASRPRLVAAHEQLAQIARRDRRTADAVEQYATIVRILSESEKDPGRRPSVRSDLATAHFNLAFALRESGQERDAIAHYEQALACKPDYVDARNSLGLTLVHVGRVDDAISQYEAALRTEPSHAQVHNNLGNALQQSGRLAEAIAHYEKALAAKPDLVSALTNLAWIRATAGDAPFRNGAEAVVLGEKACSGPERRTAGCLDVLAAAYAEAGRFDDAYATAQEALVLTRSADQAAMAEAIVSRAALYRDHRPYRTATSRRR
jgi:arylsulfatase A-like enzyme/Tfp pilus assembly protein PilF